MDRPEAIVSDERRLSYIAGEVQWIHSRLVVMKMEITRLKLMKMSKLIESFRSRTAVDTKFSL